MKRIFVSLLLIFITQSVFADLMCSVNATKYHVRYTINTYNCSSGQFLPADTEGCVSCPMGFTCNGGTYAFDASNFQGINFNHISSTTINNVCANNLPRKFFAKYTPNQYTCSAGYYLPANSVECTKCLNNNYCPGGILTFNENVPQGITICPETHPYAPQGMWQQSQCGRKLHIGDDVLYMHQSPTNPTEHRLFVQYGNNIYSANTVPKETGVDDLKMSINSEKSFHVVLEGIEYLVCDDSVPECRND